MKKLLVVCMMLVAAAIFAVAQQRQGGSAEDLAKRSDDQLAEIITGLTADQKAKLKVVHLDLAKQQIEARQANQGNMEAFRAAGQKIEEAREAKYKGILTAAQLKQYTDDRAQRRQRQGQRNN